jgi:predicted DNA-binding transcriptional regulator AlpA
LPSAEANWKIVMPDQPFDVNWGDTQKYADAIDKPNGHTGYNYANIGLFSIMSLAEAAKFAGISQATLERLVADKRGPPVVDISDRRRGFRVGDVIDWINSRVRPTGGK